MGRRRQRVWMAGTNLGEVTSTSRTQIAFEYANDILEQFPMNVPLISCSMPTRAGRHDARAFMAGLLPEGDHRRALAQQAGCLPTDVFALLDRFGQDVAGAIVIGSAAADRPQPSAEPYSADALAHEVVELATRPLAVHDDSELSIAGVQDKMLLVRTEDGNWARPVHGYPSTHILKLDDRLHPGLVLAEHTALALASAAGLSAASSELTTITGLTCLIVERFDRTPGTTGPTRVHQEDACQALGVDLELLGDRAKYEDGGGPRLRDVARVLNAWADDAHHERLALLDHVVFTVVIGNADAHGKNIAFLHPEPGHITLAPLYDTVPTGLWPNLRTRAAMSIGAAVDLPAVTIDDLVNEAKSWGVGVAVARRQIDDVLERLADACTRVENAGSLDVTGSTLARIKQLRADSSR